MDADRIVERGALNVSAFLNVIAQCEGTGGQYRAMFGYHPIRNPHALFDGWVHPNKPQSFRWSDGSTGVTTAAGRYQMIFPTASRLRRKLSVRDVQWYTPTWQDIFAMELISERGAMPFVKQGDALRAMELCAPEWASLPHSTYLQPKRSVAFAVNAFVEAGGVLA